MSVVHDTDLFHIAQLVDQLRHDDVHHRINAVKSLSSIASALGPDRTRDELLPFLTESTDDEHDVLVIIAEKLGDLVRYVGGKEYVYLILQTLEILLMNDQVHVREAAILSTETCADFMTPEHFKHYYIPFVIRLAKKDIYMARISATSLLTSNYFKLSEPSKTEFSNLFLSLCNDSTPLVRRAAAMNFSKIIKGVSHVTIQTDYIVAFNNFASHEQESIRIQSIGICVTLAEILPIELKMSKVLPVVLLLAKDRAWRVRYTFVRRLHEVITRMSDAQGSQGPLASAYDCLLTDQETEVRCAAASAIAHTCHHLSKDLVYNKLILSIQRLTIDASDSVRVAVAAGLGALVPLIGKEETVEFVLPMLLALLRDEVADVRLNVITRLDSINDVLGVEVLSQSLLPAISNLAMDGKWRVRLAVIEHIPLLLTQMSAGFFAEKLSDMCLSWLLDHVHAVRHAAADNLQVLHSRLGETWTITQAIPKLDVLTAHRNYLFRLTGLHVVRVLCSALSLSLIEKHLVPKVFHLCKDHVANVRMNCSRAFISLLKVLPSTSTYRKVIIENLNELSADTDRDVKAAALQCLKESSSL